jgi:hypothetical protein
VILGRPVNMAVALIGGIFNVLIAFNVGGFNPTAVQIGVVNILILAVVGFVAWSPPTLNPGDKINVVSPSPAPNQVQVVAVNPPVPTRTKVA